MRTDFNKVFVDTALFIYFIEKNISFGEISKSFFNFCANQDKVILTSAITHLEFAVKPYRENQLELIDKFRNMIVEAEIIVSEINITDCDLATRLRAKYSSLKNFDALQIAVAMNENCDVFMCNDKRIKTITDIQVFTLDEWNIV